MSAVLRLIRPERSDESLIAGFLLGRPPSTQRVYKNEVKACLEFANKAVTVVTAADLRGYVEHCRRDALRPGTIRHKVAVIKSLFAFLFPVARTEHTRGAERLNAAFVMLWGLVLLVGGLYMVWYERLR